MIATLTGVLAVAVPAHGASGWALWERPVDPATGQPQTEWQRTRVFEAERWCKGAMTTAINQTLQAGSKGGRRDSKAKVLEYQCHPESEDPRGPTNR